MGIFIFYIIGCLIAFILINKEYVDNLPESLECEDACIFYVLGTALSWITVIVYIFNSANNR